MGVPMKRLLLTTLIFAVVLTGSCGTLGEIQTDNIRTSVEAVVARHQVYVAADRLPDEARDTMLKQGLAALDAVAAQGGTVNVTQIEPVLTPVLNRHDVYVSLDPGLSRSQRDIYLRSSLLLREVLVEAAKKPAR